MASMEALGFINSVTNFHIPSPKVTSFKTVLPFINSRIHLTSHFQKSCCINSGKKFSKRDTFVAVQTVDYGEEEEESPEIPSSSPGDANWVAEFLGEKNPHGNLPLAKSKKLPKSRLLQGNDQMEWCVRARKVALKSIEARGLTARMERMVTGEKKKKRKKKKKQPKIDEVSQLNSDDEGEDLDLDLDLELDLDLDSDSDSSGHLKRRVSMIAGGMLEERKEKWRETLVEKLSQFSGPSDRRKEISLNKSIVEAQTAEEVLEVTGEIMMDVAKGLSPSPLSPLNIATALHRIAKNMEKVSMMRTRRLAFARQRDMCMLVGMAMAALPQCSPQGVSNIAWALSKIGGELLYMSEMDRVAEVAMSKVAELNSQNVANLAGAFASMQHSAPQLFIQLSKRASDIIHTFQPQEIAQVLWAFASLNENADSILESLDNVEQIRCRSIIEETSKLYDEIGGADGGNTELALTFSRDQLGNICWSYAVVGGLNRVFFSRVWRALIDFDISEQYREDIMFASQLHLVNQCLKLEYPHLELSLPNDVENKMDCARKTKSFNQKVTSSFQKEVYRLLVSTGLDWVREYNLEGGYTLDAALVDQKVAMEIDGPTHFSRNLVTPLGHTILKRRYVTAAGWKIISVAHQDWEELQGEFEQLDYLRRLIYGALGEESSNVLDKPETI